MSLERESCPPGEITRLGVAGLKSIAAEGSIDIRPLTILAGANSSGKSTIMQGVLLLKQTLEAPYDPGPLLINGPNAQFTSTEQMMSRGSSRSRGDATLQIRVGRSARAINLTFARANKGGGTPFELESQAGVTAVGSYVLKPGMSSDEIAKALNLNSYLGLRNEAGRREHRWELQRSRCFFEIGLVRMGPGGGSSPMPWFEQESETALIKGVIHLPGLRGNPARDYPVSSVGETFPGTFDPYVASVIAAWGRDGDERLAQLGRDLADLGLTWKVEAKSVNDTRVELRVGRLPRRRQGGSRDLVSIADVGFGVSQTLPVVVALLAARPGQLVYIEQPEIHLHPGAQAAMARLLANAARRGVRVVVETHSALLLTGVQTLVATGELDCDKVILHWFGRDDDGLTTIASRDLDHAGRFGDWPVDFADVVMDAEMRYLDAADEVLRGGEAGR